MRNGARSLLWWLPAVLIALAAGVMPDTFLDNPHSTTPHAAAFVLRFWLIILAFVYLPAAIVARLLLHWVEPARNVDNRQTIKPSSHQA